MTVFKQTDGIRGTYDKILTTTGEVTIYEIDNRNVNAIVESIFISSDGTATDLTLSFKKGSTVLFQTHVTEAVSASQLIAHYHRNMRYEHKITAQASIANHLQVSVVVIENGGGGAK